MRILDGLPLRETKEVVMERQNRHFKCDSKSFCFGGSGLLASIGTLALVASLGCSKSTNFSLLEDENRFQQSSESSNGKMDILFVIDNSGSMETSQTQIAQNFRRFISLFDSKGFDYRIAVTTTDAYMDLFGAPSSQSQFRDGTDRLGHTGYFVLESNTPDLENSFMTNIRQGITGSGDERAFQSIERTLLNPLNAGFPREDAFLSVIIVSDEDDFSHSGSTSKSGLYSYSGLYPVSRYVDFLDQLTGATADTRRQKYHVNSIAILDQACKTELENTFTGRKIAYRYMDLSDATNGIMASLCGDFGTTLSEISVTIVTAVTEYFLDREPNPDSLVVQVNGQTVPRLALEDSSSADGYKYHAETNSVTFHGSYIPGPGAAISVRFDPLTLR